LKLPKAPMLVLLATSNRIISNRLNPDLISLNSFISCCQVRSNVGQSEPAGVFTPLLIL